MEEFDIVELLKYLKKRIVLMIIIFIVVVLGGMAYSKFNASPMYKSIATILITDDESFNSETSYHELNKDLVNTYVQLLKSDFILNQTIENLELNIEVEEKYNNLLVDSVNGSQVINIEVINASKSEAANIANEVVNVFDENLETFYQNKRLILLSDAVEAEKPYNINYKGDLKKYIIFGLLLSFGIVFIIFYGKSIIEELKNNKQK